LVLCGVNLKDFSHKPYRFFRKPLFTQPLSERLEFLKKSYDKKKFEPTFLYLSCFFDTETTFRMFENLISGWSSNLQGVRMQLQEGDFIQIYLQEVYMLAVIS
jgi:hypothetical protein